MDNYDKLLNNGISAAETGSYDEAFIILTQAAEHIQSPIVKSYSAYCQAKSHGKLSAAAEICQGNIATESHNSVHYLILGRIFLLAGNRRKAIKIFHMGLKVSPNPLIIKEFKQLGKRNSPVIKVLDREHSLNRLLGKAFSTVGFR